MELANKQEIINQAIDIKDIDHVKLAQLARFTDEEVDFVKLFWEPAFNYSWIYLTKEMVVGWMGYKDTKDTMINFYKQNLLKNYEENIDYKEVTQNDELLKKFYSPNLANRNNEEKEELDRNGCSLNLTSTPKPDLGGGRNKKHYIITGECLKGLLMSANTPKGKIVRKIYIKTEKLVVLMIEIIKQQQLQIKDEEIKEKDLKLLEMKENIEQDKASMTYQMEAVKHYVPFFKRIEKSYNYIGSSDTDHNIHNEKYGKANTTELRKKALSTGNSIINEFHMRYTYEIPDDLAKPLESFVHKIFEPLAAKSKNKSAIEFFMIHDKFLHAISKDLEQHVNNYSNLINEYITKLEENSMNFKKIDDWVNETYGETKNLSNIIKLQKIQEAPKYREDNLEEIIEEVKEIREEIKQSQREIVEEVKEIREEVKQSQIEIVEEVKEIREEVKQSQIEIVEEVKEIREEIKKFMNDEHKNLVERLERLKTDIIRDIRIEGEKNYICKIKTPNAHSAPQSHYARYSGGEINHYCIGCKNRKAEELELESKIKDITHKKCSNCDVQKPLTDFLPKTESTYYSSCNSCLGKKSRSISKKDHLLKIFNEINKAELSNDDLTKLKYLITALENSTKESLKNKKQINILGKYKRCYLALSHSDKELDHWKADKEFGKKDFRCIRCRAIQNKKIE